MMRRASAADDLLKQACKLYGPLDPDTLEFSNLWPWETAPDAYIDFWNRVRDHFAAERTS